VAAFDDITSLTVNYNSRDVVERCLAALPPLHDMLVVDNASADDSVTFIENRFPSAKFVRNQQNLGFGSGVNSALSHVTTPYLLLITPDAVLTSDTLAELRDALQRYPDAAMVAPVLQVPRQGIETWVMGPHEQRQINARLAADGPFCTWFSSVAVCLWRTEALVALAGFDPDIFLYQEDLDLCLRIRKAGRSIIIVPDAVAQHINSGSAPRSAKLQWRKEWNFAWGTYYVLGKHGNRSAAIREALRCIGKRLPKAFLYALTLDAKRFIRDFAWAHGAMSYLLGRKPPRPR
jgi:N-acetylglucosaminyl-diphospho-decaprenol L-rhamnosyltransferase